MVLSHKTVKKLAVRRKNLINFYLVVVKKPNRRKFITLITVERNELLAVKAVTPLKPFNACSDPCTP